MQAAAEATCAYLLCTCTCVPMCSHKERYCNKCTCALATTLKSHQHKRCNIVACYFASTFVDGHCDVCVHADASVNRNLNAGRYIIRLECMAPCNTNIDAHMFAFIQLLVTNTAVYTSVYMRTRMYI